MKLFEAVKNQINSGYDENGLKIEVIKPEEENQIYDFVKNNFFPFEPISDHWAQPPPVNEIPFIKGIYQGYSLKTVDKTGDIKAILLNTEDSKLDHIPVTHEGLSKIYRLIHEVDKLCTFPGIGALLNVGPGATHPSCKRGGVMLKMMQVVSLYAKQKGLPGMKAYASSHYSQKLIQSKLAPDWKKYSSVKYNEILDKATGKPVFQPKPPHTEMQLFLNLFK